MKHLLDPELEFYNQHTGKIDVGGLKARIRNIVLSHRGETITVGLKSRMNDEVHDFIKPYLGTSVLESNDLLVMPNAQCASVTVLLSDKMCNYLEINKHTT